MPTIRAASTPSRRVTIKACSIEKRDSGRKFDFENEFQFQLTIGYSPDGDIVNAASAEPDGPPVFQDILKVQQESLRFRSRGKEFFFSLEFGGVYATPATPQLNGVLQMKHLVVNDVFKYRLRHAGMIESAADDNRVVRRIIISQAVTGLALTPAHLRAGQQPVEKSNI